ncbi:MAG: DNA-processing protein DprA [Chloroflexi bacterium]|nr:DNA-processing protein DprA [Chloroflexota bacterium]
MTPGDPTARVQIVALSLIPGLGGKTLDRLVAYFGTVEAVLQASERDLTAVPRIGPRLAAAIRAVDLARTGAEIERWQAAGIGLLLREDAAYPAALKPLADAPPVLFWRGNPPPLPDAPAVAVVGTRQPRPQACDLAQTLAAAIAAQGGIVVSGLAAGIDTAAHQGALRAGGVTLAVLGCGVRVPYPPDNRPLAHEIAANGALLAEVHPDAGPNSAALVARNRLISGLSRAVIVVEAGASSGSLHAARFAVSQGRAVYALDTDSDGNRLLLNGDAQPLPPDPSDLKERIKALLTDNRA